MYIHEKSIYKIFILNFSSLKLVKEYVYITNIKCLYILYAIIYVFTELQTMVPKTVELAHAFTVIINVTIARDMPLL